MIRNWNVTRPKCGCIFIFENKIFFCIINKCLRFDKVMSRGVNCSVFGCRKRKKLKSEDDSQRSDSDNTEDEESQIKTLYNWSFHRYRSNTRRH